MISTRSCSYVLIPALLVALAGGCNMVTGADEVVLVNKIKKPGSSGEPVGGQASVGGFGGAGGVTPAGGFGGTTEPPPPPCNYPPGPYGNKLNETVPPTFSWNGYPEGPVGQVAFISMEDYLDCDGSRGIHAIMVETTQYG